MNDLEKSVELVHAISITGKGAGEIETEPVNVHFEHPIAKAVHHELERAGVQQIESVAGTGEIEIEPRIFRPQAIGGDVIDPAEGQGRAEMAAFGGMIVNHVENHFDAGGVQIAHHGFEFGHLAAEITAAGVVRFRGEETDACCNPSS